MSSRLILFLIVAGVLALVSGQNIWQIQSEHWKKYPVIHDDPLDTPDPKAPDAYAYMYCSRPEVDRSLSYFNPVLMAAYKLKIINEHYDANRREVIILACSYTSEEQLQAFKDLNVTVITVDPIIPHGGLSDNPGYIDQFTKYQLWRFTKWQRILYMDIDTTPTKEIIKIWDEPQAQIINEIPSSQNKDSDYHSMKIGELYPYLFAAVLDFPCRVNPNGGECWSFRDKFNAGSFMLKPSIPHFKALIYHMNNGNLARYFMEQAVLNSFYSPGGPFPWAQLPAAYNSHYDFPSEMSPAVGIQHCKIWGKGPPQFPHLKALHENWLIEFSYLFNNQPLSLDRVYTPDDIFYLRSYYKDAYVFFLCTKPEHENTSRFLYYQNLKQTINRLRRFHEEEKDTMPQKDFIVLAADYIPRWQLEELQKSNVLVIRVQPLSINSPSENKSWIDQFTKLYFWKLVEWDRLVYIDADLFVSNKSFIQIWNEPNTQVVNGPPPKNAGRDLYDVPKDQVKKFYPYLMAGALDLWYKQFKYEEGQPGGYFNAGLFAMKPSIVHYDYLMKIKDTNVYNKYFMEQDMLNYVYHPEGYLPWGRIDSGYNVWAESEGMKKGAKAYHGRLWEFIHKSNIAPLVKEVFNVFHQGFLPQSLLDLGANPESNKNCPAHCLECDNPTSCSKCSDGYSISQPTYLHCPLSTPIFGDSECRTLPDETVSSCLHQGDCHEFRVNETDFWCSVAPTNPYSVVAYCPSCEKGFCQYVRKGTYCEKSSGIPKTSTPSETPNPPKTPETPKSSETSKTQETPKTPKTPKTPETPKTPKNTTEIPKTPIKPTPPKDKTETPKNPDPVKPKDPETPKTQPKTPDNPKKSETETPPKPDKATKPTLLDQNLIITIVIAVIASISLVLAGCFIYKRYSKGRYEELDEDNENQVGSRSEIPDDSESQV